MELKSLVYNIKSQKNTVHSLAKQVELEQTTLKQAEVGILSLRAAEEKAKLDLEQTTVHAKSDGYVQAMYVSVGKSVRATDALFLFISLFHPFVHTCIHFIR